MQLFAVVVAVDQRTTRNGDPFLAVILSDKSGQIKCNYWNCDKGSFLAVSGDIVWVKIKCDMYNEKYSYTLEDYRPPLPHETVNYEDFIRSAPIAGEDMYNKLMDVADTLVNSYIRDVVKLLYTENKEELIISSAAKSVHHNIRSGLLWHVFRMVGVGNAICKTYDKYLSRDLLIAGIMLHDIGKLQELSTDNLGVATYTAKGSLLGHSVIGCNMIQYACERLETPEDVFKQLAHIVASHHGEPEYGATVRPSTFEATMVHLIDVMDAQAYQFEETLKNLNSDSFSDRIFGLDTRVYKHTLI